MSEKKGEKKKREETEDGKIKEGAVCPKGHYGIEKSVRFLIRWAVGLSHCRSLSSPLLAIFVLFFLLPNLPLLPPLPRPLLPPPR